MASWGAGSQELLPGQPMSVAQAVSGPIKLSSAFRQTNHKSKAASVSVQVDAHSYVDTCVHTYAVCVCWCVGVCVCVCVIGKIHFQLKTIHMC